MAKIKDRPEFKSKSPALTFASDTLVNVAVHAMSVKNYGAAVIIDSDNKPVGIVTERDFMRRLLDKDLDPKTTRLSQIMTRDLKVAQPDDNIIDWVRQMSNERFRHVPIVDQNGILVNIMSQGDFVSYTWPELLSQVKDRAAYTIASKYQILTIAFGIALYTLATILVLRLT